MVSRRKILSRSTDDLNLEGPVQNEPEEEDVWFNKEKLYKVKYHQITGTSVFIYKIYFADRLY
jgi:hypothetical protein